MALERLPDPFLARPKAPPPAEHVDPAESPHAPLIAYRSIARWLLVVVLAASAWFFHDFLVPVLAAMIIAFASWPLNRRLQETVGMSRTGAAAFLVLTIVLFLVIPLVLAIGYAVGEVQVWVEWAIDTNRNGAASPEWIAALPGIGTWLVEQWDLNIGHPGAIGELVHVTSGATIGGIYRGVLTVGTLAFDLSLALIFMLITVFILYRDGDRLVAHLDRVGEKVLPTRWERISRVVPRTISATVTGMTLIAIGEGVILGTAYWIAGVPSPVTFGIITGFMALIPGGAPLSMTLVSIYLVASGDAFSGVALFIWGCAQLFVVDKTIRPTLVGGPIKLPFLLTFFGLIGGVKTMGIVGLFVGPVLMSLLVAIWREWVREIELKAEPPPD